MQPLFLVSIALLLLIRNENFSYFAKNTKIENLIKKETQSNACFMAKIFYPRLQWFLEENIK